MIRKCSWSLRVIYCRPILPGELNINFDRFKPSYSFTVSYYLCSVLSFFVLSKTCSQRIVLKATEQWETQNDFAWGSPLTVTTWLVLSLAVWAAHLLPGSWSHTINTHSAWFGRSWTTCLVPFPPSLLYLFSCDFGCKGSITVYCMVEGSVFRSPYIK